MPYSHPWRQRLLAPLPAEQVCSPIAPDNLLWESVETELVKLGSLAHAHVNLEKVAADCLTLLETHTKDMRVLAQLLRCLQHPANAASFATALMLLDSWVEAYWSFAFPASAVQKQRVMMQIIKRFEAVQVRVGECASSGELKQLLELAEQFERRWLAIIPGGEAVLGELVLGLRRVQRRQEAQANADAAPSPPSPVNIPPNSVDTGGTIPPALDTSSERAWRQTQLKMAELLIEKQSMSPVGYRLRRHAIWSNITAAPLVVKDNRTQLAPVSADMVDAYRSAIAQPDNALWGRIEQSLMLAPYWFEGHMLSAQVAGKLGADAVASAIREELAAFVGRLPTLCELTFSDGSPFLSSDCRQWLQPEGRAPSGCDEDVVALLLSRCKEQGLTAALNVLDERLHHLTEPRARFYTELAQADLLASEGMASLALQLYQHLWQETQRLGLIHWEPGLVNRLARHTTTRSN